MEYTRPSDAVAFSMPDLPLFSLPGAVSETQFIGLDVTSALPTASTVNVVSTQAAQSSVPAYAVSDATKFTVEQASRYAPGTYIPLKIMHLV